MTVDEHLQAMAETACLAFTESPKPREIEYVRAMIELQFQQAAAQARSEALEEAARVADELVDSVNNAEGTMTAATIAHEIRALKGEGDD